jgi:hypothetical protein
MLGFEGTCRKHNASETQRQGLNSVRVQYVVTASFKVVGLILDLYNEASSAKKFVTME